MADVFMLAVWSIGKIMRRYGRIQSVYRMFDAGGVNHDITGKKIYWRRQVAIMKLNVGCGTDYREGFINIDGNILNKPDLCLNLPGQRLIDYFAKDSIQYVLIQDFLEHVFHWEAERILKDVYAILQPGGRGCIRVPNFQKIIRSWRLSDEKKIVLLYGGQDIPQGEKNPEPRKRNPEYYCHKYAYTPKTLRDLLKNTGFEIVSITMIGTNILVDFIKA